MALSAPSAKQQRNNVFCAEMLQAGQLTKARLFGDLDNSWNSAVSVRNW
jgi:hypothetical protein